MQLTARLLTFLGLAFLGSSALAATAGGPVIETEDVDLFYKLYDATGGHPTAEQLQHDYLDRGSAGLHELANARSVNGDSIAAALAAHPDIYAAARDCAGALPRIRTRVPHRCKNSPPFTLRPNSRP